VSELPLRPGSNLSPRPYVHYQLLGYQDVFTPVGAQGEEKVSKDKQYLAHSRWSLLTLFVVLIMMP